MLEIRSTSNKWMPDSIDNKSTPVEGAVIRFWAIDLQTIENILHDERNKGNQWLAFNTLDGYSIVPGMKFFKDESQLSRFCHENTNEHSLYVGWEIDLVMRSLSNLHHHPYDTESYSLQDCDAAPSVYTFYYTKTDPRNQHLEQSNNSFMNEQNLQFLKDNLKYAGFKEVLYPGLEENIKKGIPEFTLNAKTDFAGKQFEANLHFKKGDQGDMYFFNKYDAQLTSADTSGVEQTFYMDKGKGYTAKEAFNLLDGRAVFKEHMDKDQNPYHAWRRIDFENKTDAGNYQYKQTHENYGYDVATALAKHDFKELAADKQPEWIQRSLERGNQHQVSGPNDEKLFISAMPESGKSNKLNVVDGNGKEVTNTLKGTSVDNGLFKKEELKNGLQQEVKQDGMERSNGKENKKDTALAGNDDLLGKKDKKKLNGKAKGEEGSLLPKKRERTGKGLKV